MAAAPDAAVCRDADGRIVPEHPGIGSSTALPTPRDLHTSGAAGFRAGPTPDAAPLFRLEQPVPVTILRECGIHRLARVSDGRTGWVDRSRLSIRTA